MFSFFFLHWGYERVLCNWLWICLQYVGALPVAVVLGEENLLVGSMLSYLSQFNSFSVWFALHIWLL